MTYGENYRNFYGRYWKLAAVINIVLAVASVGCFGALAIRYL